MVGAELSHPPRVGGQDVSARRNVGLGVFYLFVCFILLTLVFLGFLFSSSSSLSPSSTQVLLHV